MDYRNKKTRIKLHLFYCLMQLLLEVLDDLSIKSPKGIVLKKTLIEMCELLNNDCADTFAVKKTTYFQAISNKIYTIMRKEFNSEM